MMNRIINILGSIAADKYLHFIAGLVIAQLYVNAVHFVDPVLSWLGIFASLIAGLGKELYDMNKKGGIFDCIDLAFTLLGGFIGTILTINL